jgi:hypothetical protein
LYRIGREQTEVTATKLLHMLRLNANKGQVHHLNEKGLFVQGILHIPPQAISGIEQDLGAPIFQLVRGIRTVQYPN